MLKEHTTLDSPFPFEEIDLLEEVDLLRLEVGRQHARERKAEAGQFFTAAPLARFMASLLKGQSIDGKRKDELKRLFCNSQAGLVFVTTFLTRGAMVRYLQEISWEIEVWVADHPTHVIHFDGEQLLGPHDEG